MDQPPPIQKTPSLIHNPLGWILFSILILATPIWKLLESSKSAQEGDAALTELDSQGLGDSPLPPVFNEPASLPLLSHTDQVVTLDTLNGSIVIVSFLFTRCPDICPALALRFLDLEEQVPDSIDGVPIHFVSITVDPKFDRPEVLSEYKSRFDEAPDRWQLWTGEEQHIDATVGQFQLALERVQGSDGPEIVHSDRFVILDTQGRIRNFYPSNEIGMTSLIEDLPLIASGS